MPWYLHARGEEPESGTVYERKEDAVAARTNGQSITFVASYVETFEWKQREKERLRDGTYAPIPWKEHYRVTDVMQLHYAHLSTAHIGQIAYTPNDEYGVQDRQLRARPGKYLTEFASDVFTKAEIDAYCAQVRGFDGKLQLARTADAIESVYVHGPLSCMSHGVDSFQGDVHPVRVYGDSDLAVAYIGTLDACTSRCVVWPEKLIYTRIYGDTALQCILKSAGYTHGSLAGAKIRAIRYGSTYVMPFIDAAAGAEHIGQYMRLTDSSSEYSVKETCGLVAEEQPDEPEDELPMCQHCENRLCDDYDDTYCARCERNRQTCQHCDDHTWDNEYIDRFGAVCSSCLSNLTCTCSTPHCNNEWYEVSLTALEQGERTRLHLTDYCVDCAATLQQCYSCKQCYDKELLACAHCGIATRDESTPDLLTPLEVHGDGSLRWALHHGAWIKVDPTDFHTVCQIHDCHCQLHGQIAFRSDICKDGARGHDGHYYYCAACCQRYSSHGGSTMPTMPIQTEVEPCIAF